MNQLPDISKIASALSHSTKSILLDNLMDKRGHTLLELAKIAQIEPQTASYHLKNFEKLGWVRVEKSGRFHYFFLDSIEVAQLIEQFSPMSPEKPTSALSQTTKMSKVREFRSCYDHMAGRVGHAITQALLSKKLIALSDNEFQLTALGETFFAEELQIDLTDLQRRKRHFTVACLDWSERQHHLGGALGNALFDYFKANHFVLSDNTEKRALLLTPAGTRFLKNKLNLTI